MRAVFQLPASMTSVVDAPRAVSSDASPTRPLCAVKPRPRLLAARPPLVVPQRAGVEVRGELVAYLAQ